MLNSGKRDVIVKIAWIAGAELVKGHLHPDVIATECIKPENSQIQGYDFSNDAVKDLLNYQPPEFTMTGMHIGYSNTPIFEYRPKDDSDYGRLEALIHGYRFLVFESPLISASVQRGFLSGLRKSEIVKIHRSFLEKGTRPTLGQYSFNHLSRAEKASMLRDRVENGFPKDIEELIIFTDQELVELRDSGFISALAYSSEVYNRELEATHQAKMDGDTPFLENFQANLNLPFHSAQMSNDELTKSEAELNQAMEQVEAIIQEKPAQVADDPFLNQIKEHLEFSVPAAK